MRPGRGVADRVHLRLVEHQPVPAWVPERAPARPSIAPVAMMWCGMVAGGWFMAAGIAWTAYAVCRLTGVCR